MPLAIEIAPIASDFFARNSERLLSSLSSCVVDSDSSDEKALIWALQSVSHRILWARSTIHSPLLVDRLAQFLELLLITFRQLRNGLSLLLEFFDQCSLSSPELG